MTTTQLAMTAHAVLTAIMVVVIPLLCWTQFNFRMSLPTWNTSTDQRIERSVGRWLTAAISSLILGALLGGSLITLSVVGVYR